MSQMEKVIFGDTLIHIINQSNPMDVFIMALTCKHLKNKINRKYFEQRTLAEINKRLLRILGKNFYNLKNHLMKHKLVICDDFILQCALEEEWTKDICLLNKDSLTRPNNPYKKFNFGDYNIYQRQLTNKSTKDIFGSNYSYDGTDHINFINFCDLLQKRINYDLQMDAYKIKQLYKIYDKRGFRFNENNDMLLQILQKKEDTATYLIKYNDPDYQQMPFNDRLKLNDFMKNYTIINGDISHIESMRNKLEIICKCDEECSINYCFLATPNIKHYHAVLEGFNIGLETDTDTEVFLSESFEPMKPVIPTKFIFINDTANK